MELYAKSFFIPNLVSQSDQMMIEEALQTSPGIEAVEVDPVLHTLYIKTANQDGMRDVEYVLSAAGYTPAPDSTPSRVSLK